MEVYTVIWKDEVEEGVRFLGTFTDYSKAGDCILDDISASGVDVSEEDTLDYYIDTEYQIITSVLDKRNNIDIR